MCNERETFLYLIRFCCCDFRGACPFLGPIYEEDLGNGYIVCALDVMQDVHIIIKNKRGSGGFQVVPPTVFAYGWDDDFILAKRHPEKKDRKVDTSVTYWYIIEVASGDVHGPLNGGEFRKLRTKLKVPEEISFKTIQ